MAWWVLNSKFLSERILLPSSTKLHLKKFENAKRIRWKYITSYPGLWTALLVRDSAEEIHGFGEYCKYRHIHQAIAKANPWNKQHITSCLIYHSSLPTSPTIYTVDSTAICSRCPCSPSSPKNKNILAHIWSCKYFEYSESWKPWAGIIKATKEVMVAKGHGILH